MSSVSVQEGALLHCQCTRLYTDTVARSSDIDAVLLQVTQASNVTFTHVLNTSHVVSKTSTIPTAAQRVAIPVDCVVKNK